VAVPHSYAPWGIVACREDVSSGGITEIPAAVVQPALEAMPWVTPTRNDTLVRGATTSA
jgi:hypothetical protein